MKNVIPVIGAALAGMVGWLFWGPVRVFFFSLIPAMAEYAWIGKLLVVVLVAWMGGIALPLAIFAISIFIWSQA